MLASVCGGKIVCHQLVELVAEYCVMPTAAANRTTRLRGKPEKSGSSMRAENFAHAVGAEIETQHAVAVFHAAIVADHRRHDELVELFVGIGVGDDGRRVRKMRPFRFDDGVVGFADALPALVAIHGVVAAAHRRDPQRTFGSAAIRRLTSSAADCGGVSRPSVNA